MAHLVGAPPLARIHEGGRQLHCQVVRAQPVTIDEEVLITCRNLWKGGRATGEMGGRPYPTRCY